METKRKITKSLLQPGLEFKLNKNEDFRTITNVKTLKSEEEIIDEETGEKFPRYTFIVETDEHSTLHIMIGEEIIIR